VFPTLKTALRAVGIAAILCGTVACTLPRKTDAQRQADNEMANRVEQALASDKELFSRHIVVRADDGVVRLTGFVWDPPEIMEAVRIASSVDGVSRVVNSLELQRNGMDDSAVSR
jgi:osmotically-inducible protein OsmY